MSIDPIILYGLLGGFFVELLGLYSLRKQAPEAMPAYYKSVLYWTITGLMIVAGGGLTYAYRASGIELKPLLAINIGASAPLLIGSFVRNAPSPTSIN